MRFDYGLTNPPFSIKGNTAAYKTIIELLTKHCDSVYFIASTGGLGIVMWKKHYGHISKAARLGFDVFPVEIKTVSGLWTKKISEDLEIQMHNFKWKAKMSEFPIRVPDVKMSLEEYRETFDQNGVQWEVFPEKSNPKFPIMGVYRDCRKGDSVCYHFSDNISTKLINGKISYARYIPVKNPQKGEVLAQRLSILEKENKIHGCWGLGYRYVTRDLDPIRKDLV